MLFTGCGIASALLSLELLLRILPVATSSATGYYIDPLILTYPPEHRFTTATGWNLQRARVQQANNFGFLADHDFTFNPEAVALIGDSFVEASMLAPPDRLAAQLEKRLDSRQVYALGAPGTALLDYGERVRFASEHFGIRDFVLLLEHGDVAQSLCGSGNVNGPCLDPQTLAPRIEKIPPPGNLKRVLRQLALPQYLFSQLKLDPAGWMHRVLAGSQGGVSSARRDPSAIAPAAIDRVLGQFFARIQPYPRRHLIFILTGNARPGDPVRDRLFAAAARNGASVIESAPLLEPYSQRTGLSMHVSPQDPHLNGIALGLIAVPVAALLDQPRRSESVPH